MNDNDQEAVQPGEGLREYRAPWKGELVLVCTKCTRKIKKRSGSKGLASVKKWFKKRRKRDDGDNQFRVVGIDCLKMCPKDGVTVSRQHQLGRDGAEVSILRSEADLESFYQQVSARGA